MKKIILLIMIGVQLLVSGLVFAHPECCMSGEAEADTIYEEIIIKTDVLMRHFEPRTWNGSTYGKWFIDTETPEDGYGYSYKTATDGCEGQGVWVARRIKNLRNVEGYVYAKFYKQIFSATCKCKQNQAFPDLNETTQKVAFTWNNPEKRTNECIADLNGTIQEQVVDCNSTYRCVVEKVEECTEKDFDFPKKATNQQIDLTWTKTNNKTTECLALDGVVQEAKKDCKRFVV